MMIVTVSIFKRDFAAAKAKSLRHKNINERFSLNYEEYVSLKNATETIDDDFGLSVLVFKDIETQKEYLIIGTQSYGLSVVPRR